MQHEVCSTYEAVQALFSEPPLWSNHVRSRDDKSNRLCVMERSGAWQRKESPNSGGIPFLCLRVLGARPSIVLGDIATRMQPIHGSALVRSSIHLLQPHNPFVMESAMHQFAPNITPIIPHGDDLVNSVDVDGVHGGLTNSCKW